LADAYVELGKIYYHIGLTDKAVEANEQAQRLDPSARVAANRKVRALIDAGRIEEVRHELDRIGPSLEAYVRADALLTMGQAGEALKIFRQSEAPAASHSESGFAVEPGPAAFYSVVYARLGQREEAERMVAVAIPAARNPTGLSDVHHAQFHIGCALALLGRPDEALKWLTTAANEGYPSYPRFATDESLAPLRGHAGFVKLLARLRQDMEHFDKL
jgi:tetratricopeptide (TPR) repeat protein